MKVEIVAPMAKRGNCTARLEEILGKNAKIDPVPIPPKKSLRAKLPGITGIKVPPAVQSGINKIAIIVGCCLAAIVLAIFGGIMAYWKCVKANTNAVDNIRVALDNTRRIGDMLEMQARTATQAIQNQNRDK